MGQRIHEKNQRLINKDFYDLPDAPKRQDTMHLKEEGHGAEKIPLTFTGATAERSPPLTLGTQSQIIY